EGRPVCPGGVLRGRGPLRARAARRAGVPPTCGAATRSAAAGPTLRRCLDWTTASTAASATDSAAGATRLRPRRCRLVRSAWTRSTSLGRMGRAGLRLRALRSRLLSRSTAAWHRPLLRAAALGRRRLPLAGAAFRLRLTRRLRSAAFGAGPLLRLHRPRLWPLLLTLLLCAASLRLRLGSRAALLLTLLRRWLRLLRLLRWLRR